MEINNNVEDCAALAEALSMPTEYLIEFIFQLYTNKCASMFRYFMNDGMLQIMSVNMSDQGIYTCIARTSLDEDNATALLTVLGKMV